MGVEWIGIIFSSLVFLMSSVYFFLSDLDSDDQLSILKQIRFYTGNTIFILGGILWAIIFILV